MSTLTVQPSGMDNYIRNVLPNNNYGNDQYLRLYNIPSDIYRLLLHFDTTAIPTNATITSATLSLYYYSYNFTDPDGLTVWAYKLSRTDWAEIESTWNRYKTGSNWSSAGGDYVTSSPSGSSQEMPASYGWVEWTITDIVQDAVTAGNETNILLKYADENADYPSPASVISFYSNDYSTTPSYRPKLYIEYTLPPDAPTDVAASTNNPTQVDLEWTASPTGVDYKVLRDGADASGWLGDVTSWSDTGADAPVITPASATASRNRYFESVKMKTNEASVANGTTHEYTVIAKDGVGRESEESDPAEGYRQAMAVSYQWQRSAGDSDASYTNLEAGAVRTHWDYTAPDYPAARYYRCKITSTGADDAYTTAARGYRRNPALAAAPYKVFMVVKDVDGNTLANVEPAEPSRTEELNQLPQFTFTLPADSEAAGDIDEDAECWLYVDGELQNIYYMATEDGEV